jgi:LPXTG-motif cell wall-anchored protein
MIIVKRIIIDKGARTLEKIDEIKHYKLYKAGKLWLTMAIATFSLGVMVSSVNADQVSANSSASAVSERVVSSSAAVNSSAAVPATSAGSKSTTQQSLAPDQPGASQATTSAQSAAKVDSSAAKSSANQATKDNTKANSSTKKEAALPALPDLDNNLLSKAGSFHIFANEVQIGADVNGNIATQHYISGNEFGTRNESHNYTKGDVYYIETVDQMGSNAFRNSENYVVFGEDTKVEIKNGQVFVNGTRMDHLKASAVYKKSGYIDFQKEFDNLTSLANYYARQKQTDGVKVNFENNNNNYIDVSNVAAGTKIIYVTVPTGCLTSSQPLTIKGLSSSEDGPVVVMNVNGSVNFNTQTKLEYDDGQTISPNEGHSKPNHVLWNFGANGGTLNINSGYLLGSVLNPQGEVNANVNVDGNLIANRVNISGGESHRWDLRGGTYVDIHQPSTPSQSSQVTQPSQTSQTTQPTQPSQTSQTTQPTQPSQTSQTTQPTQPSQTSQTTQPTQPSQTSQTTQPTQPSQTSQTTQPTQPSQTSQTTQPTQPSQTSQTTQPTQPSQTSQTTQPTQPSQTSQTTQPTQPSQTSQTTQPTQPSQTSQTTQSTSPAYPVIPDNPKSSTPTQPNQTQPTSIQSTTPAQSQQPTEPATSETNQPTQPVHQTDQQQPSSPVETQAVKTTPAQSQQAQSQSATATAAGLPQTGNQNETAVTVLGLLTASFGMLFGLKKRHFE